MTVQKWSSKPRSVRTLTLDEKNPRLGREAMGMSPGEIIQFLFDHDKAIDVAKSIASKGFFANEPLLVIEENGKSVVVEGNRRLAALKALLEPGLLDGKHKGTIERLCKTSKVIEQIKSVPVVIAPNRKATDKLLASRHVGTTVERWSTENKASFILDKLNEGYSNDELRDELNFSLGDIQSARETRAVADMARSLNLPDELQAKLENPRHKILTNLERVIKSKAGKSFLHIESDPEHGIRGKTTQKQFKKGFTKLVTELATSKLNSRKLNKNEDIERELKKFSPEHRPQKVRGSFVPSDIIKGKTVSSAGVPKKMPSMNKSSKAKFDTVIPKSFKVNYGHDRLVEIRNELVKLKPDAHPNASAVLIRVFLELSILDYLDRIDELKKIREKIKKKGQQLPKHGGMSLSLLIPSVKRIAKKNLNISDSKMVTKALTYDEGAPFSITDMHSFVHSNDHPDARDIRTFWKRTEPLFRLMLEEDHGNHTL